MSLHVQAMEPAVSIQGDLFDPGFGTAAAVDAAVARLLEGSVEPPRVSNRGLVKNTARACTAFCGFFT